jgi:hypothetical protein
MTKWIVEVEKDDKGGLWMPLPVDALAQMGWCDGTELFWEVKEGKWTVRKRDDETSSTERPDTDKEV